ncbi:MAG: response regulator [Planctomycetaceae bacterium]|nr:response regulator [Planctomycetaceae bacterium]MBT6920408.1 response regulator [Planctomycetaceae bacterium]
MSKPKIIVAGIPGDKPSAPEFIETTGLFNPEECDFVSVDTPADMVAMVASQPVTAVLLAGQITTKPETVAALLMGPTILEHFPDGVALLDSRGRVLWANDILESLFDGQKIASADFLTALGTPNWAHPSGDRSLPSTWLDNEASAESGGLVLRMPDDRFLHLQSSPLFCVPPPGLQGMDEKPGNSPEGSVVVVRDVTRTMLEQQKRAAIHQAGQTLADLTPTELADMTVQERIELLKSNIIYYSKDLLKFDVLEIRLLDKQTSRLEPLLAEGMQPEAESRVLFAREENNGVTGYVAATGRSYFCDNTIEDIRFLEGCKGAKSSITVPLLMHTEVIGTFNVESPEPGSFTDIDLQFLQIFAQDVAASLNTLELLVAEKASTAAESVEAIHGAVALPVDQLLNDTVNVMERYIGHDPDVVERLQRILKNARDIKLVIQRVGEKMTPSYAQSQGRATGQTTALKDRSILVVDADDEVRAAAHSLLERQGCIVETARDGNEAISMVKAVKDTSYDAIIADIRLPDMSGYELLVKLQDVIGPVPLILMTGFGYDPGHSIVKARQAGVELVLFKPFRLDQLLETVERCVLNRPAAC